MRIRTSRWVALAVAFGLALPAGAQAQEPGAVDPSPGSPSGTIYEIPVDQGRGDAAPRPRGGDAPAAAGGGESDRTPSPIRSDNGFGTSSEVPGAASTPQSRSGGGGEEPAGDEGRGSSGGGGAEARSGEGDVQAGTTVREASVSQSPSLSRAYLLLGLGVAVALALAAGAWLVGRRESGGRPL